MNLRFHSFFNSRRDRWLLAPPASAQRQGMHPTSDVVNGTHISWPWSLPEPVSVEPFVSNVIKRTDDTAPAAVQDMSVDHRCLDVAVAEQFLDGADIVTGLQQMRSEGVP